MVIFDVLLQKSAPEVLAEFIPYLLYKKLDFLVTLLGQLLLEDDRVVEPRIIIISLT